MTVRVERTFELPATPEAVWAIISDPEKRARPISVVDRFEVTGEGEATWHLRLPIPFVRRTFAVKTREIERDPPRYVKFTGSSKVMEVVGEHRLEETADGCRVINSFVVDGRIPGVEQFFERNFDAELRNIEDAFRGELS